MVGLCLAAVILAPACARGPAQEAATWRHDLEATEGLTSGWGQLCDDIQVTLNQDAAYIAEGGGSVRLFGVSRAEGEGNRYLALNVPAPDVDLTGGMLTFHAWTSLPESTQALYVRAYDAEGKRVASWYSWSGVLGGTAGHAFELQPMLSLGGLAWEDCDTPVEGHPVRRFEFIIGTGAKGVPIDLYVDDLRVVPERYRRFADIAEPKARVPETRLAEGGRPSALVVRPSDIAYDAAVAALVEGVKAAGGVELPVETDERARQDLSAFIAEMQQTDVVLVGSIHSNRALLPFYSRSACHADDVFPGLGGYEVRTIHDPWGTGRNAIVVGAADPEGATAGVAALLGRVTGGADLTVRRTVEVKLTGEAERRWGRQFTDELGEGYLEKVRAEAERRIETGAHQGLGGYATSPGGAFALTGRDDYARAFVWLIRRWKEHHDAQPGTYGGPWGMDADFALHNLVPQWDLVEESPALTDQDRLDVMRILFEFVGSDCAPKAQSVLGNEHVRFNHQTFPALGLLFAGEYFSRDYQLAEGARWTEIADACFRMQAKAWKPHEDCNGYQWLTLGHLIRYALAKPDFAYFENGNARKAAELAILSSDNLGYSVTYGDTGAYVGWWSENPILSACAWYYDDATYRWAAALKRRVSGRTSLGEYTSEGPTELPASLVGAQRFALDPYYHRTFGGPDVLPLEATVDKVVMRSGFEPTDPYLLLDGLSNGGHRHYDGNSVSRWTENGRIWLADADYIKSLPKYHNGVLVLRDGSSQTIPDFCEQERFSDLGRAALSTTTLRNYAGADWRRHVLWLKGKCFIIADQLIAREAGAYSVRPIWQTIGEVTPIDGGLSITQDGQHAAIVCAPKGRLTVTDDPDTGRNWSAYPWSAEPVVRRLQAVYNVDLKPGGRKTIFTILRASGEAAPQVRAASPVDGFLYAEIDGTKVLAGVVPPGEEGRLLDLGLQAEAFIATPETLDVFGLKRAVYMGQEVSVDAPVDLELEADRMQATVRAEQATTAYIPFMGQMVLPRGVTQQDLPAGAEIATQMVEDMFRQIAALPDQPAPARPAPEGLPTLRRVFDYRETPPAYLLTGNRGSREAVDAGAQLTGDPAPLAQNVFGNAGEANRVESLLDGDVSSTAGGVMWDGGQTVTANLHLDAAYDVSSVVVKAWHATSSSKGKVYQVRSIRIEGSTDGFRDSRRLLAETTDRESHPNWGGEPRVPHAYRFEGLQGKVQDLRITLAPRQGDEVEGEADPAQCGIYLAELEVWGNGEGLADKLRSGGNDFEALALADLDADGRAETIAGGANGKLCVLNADGTVRWTRDLGAPVHAVTAAPLVGEGLAVIAGGDGGKIAAYAPDGGELWTFTAPYYKRAAHVRVLFPARLAEGRPAVIAGCDNWRYYALDAAGAELWHYESVHGSTAGAAGDVDGDGVDEVACGTEYYWWHLVNAQGGKIWSYSTSTGPTANACAMGDLNGDGKREVLFGGADANVHAIGPDGKLLWKLNTGDEVTALACADADGDGAEEALVGSLSGNVYAVKGDGSLLWRTDVGSAVTDLCVTGGRVCALTAPGHVCVLEAQTGQWSAIDDLGAPGLRLVAGREGSNLLGVATEGGKLVGLAW
ncbi:MAG: hypothetical protein FJX74_00365 [Armatimonadetes bacterium]|nr:hypothetical protein [Armatimonadota bacterium]